MEQRTTVSKGCPQKKWEFSDEFDIVFVTLLLEFSCFTKYNRMQSKHKQTKCEHSTSRRNSYRSQLSQ